MAYRMAREMGITDDVLLHYGIQPPPSEGDQASQGPLGEATEEIVTDRNGSKTLKVGYRGTGVAGHAACPCLSLGKWGGW